MSDLWWLWYIVCPVVYAGGAVTLSFLWTSLYPSGNDTDLSFGIVMAWLWPVTIGFWVMYLLCHDLLKFYYTKLKAVNDKRVLVKGQQQ
jgi:hypothetical protein